MNRSQSHFAWSVVVLLISSRLFATDSANEVKETRIDGPNRVTLKVRMEGPYTAEVPLQVVCYFKYSAAAAKKMAGAPVELDRHLGGVIGVLRESGDFRGERLESLLIQSPPDSIKAKALLLIGLGDEESLSLEVMEQVGMTALREASRIGATKVAFAPLIRDQGNSKLATGAVETSVVRGMLTAYDTELRLQKEGLSSKFVLEEWWVEAGPAFYDETVTGVKEAAGQAAELAKKKSSLRYRVTAK